MQKQVTHISQSRLGNISSIVISSFTLLLASFMLFAMTINPDTDLVSTISMGVHLLIGYVGLGLMGGLLAAGFYSLVVGWVGDIDMVIESNLFFLDE